MNSQKIMPTNFRGQSYSKLKSQCLKTGVLYEDTEFPANGKSLFFSKVDNDIVWKRPKELCKVPRLVVESVNLDDLNTGALGNLWFVSACTSLALEPKLFQRVVVDHRAQEWDDLKNQYAGIFHFQFWRFGEWVDVVVDDRLPTKDGKLIFVHSKTRNEFWSPLLEKAYAKLYGDYESLKFGYVADALVDFTGGVCEKLQTSKLFLDSPENQTELFNKLNDASENKALINAMIDATDDGVGKLTNDGLAMGINYNVTGVKNVVVSKSLQGALGSNKLCLLRLFNPLGTSQWCGPYSETPHSSRFYARSQEWLRVSKGEWEKMGVKFRQEGEFWMAFDDFIKCFNSIQICHFVNTSFFSVKKSWSESIMNGQWSHAGRNGGKDYFSATFLSNPQYLFDIIGITDRIMVSLEQHDIGGGRQFLGDRLNTIGFHIMKVEDNRKYRIHVQGEKIFTSEYESSRSVYGTTVLKRGRYVIVPTTKESGGTGDFMLRLYTGSSANAKVLEKDAPSNMCCGAKYTMVTTITVKGADGLELPVKDNGKGTLNTQVNIKCEGEVVKSICCNNASSPIWNVMATFYRKKSSEPIILEILNVHKVKNDILGIVTVDDVGNETTGQDKKLEIRAKKTEDLIPGKVDINIKSSYELTTL